MNPQLQELLAAVREKIAAGVPLARIDSVLQAGMGLTFQQLEAMEQSSRRQVPRDIGAVQNAYQKALTAVRANPQDQAAHARLRSAIAEVNEAEQEQAAKVSPVASFGLGMSQGLTFGLGNEAAAALEALVRGAAPGGQGFREGFQGAREAERSVREANPRAALAGDVVGSLLVPIPGAGTAARAGGRGLLAAVGKAPLRTAIREGATAGGLLAGVGAVGRSEGDLGERATAGLLSAAGGAVVGAGLPVAATLAVETLRRFSGPFRAIWDRFRTNDVPFETAKRVTKREARKLGLKLDDDEINRIALAELETRQLQLRARGNPPPDLPVAAPIVGGAGLLSQQENNDAALVHVLGRRAAGLLSP